MLIFTWNLTAYAGFDYVFLVPEELDELFTEEEYNNYLIENELINDKGDPIKG